MANLGELPTEILEKIFSHLNTFGLSRCSQVNRRFRNICQEKSVEKVNLCSKEVSLKKLQNILGRGCKYLNLCDSIIKNDPQDENAKSRVNSKIISKLKYLEMSGCAGHEGTLEWIVDSCQSLEKFSYDHARESHGFINRSEKSTPFISRLFTQNGPTLKVLNLTNFGITGEEIILLVDKCTNLSELSIAVCRAGPYLYLAQNITTNIRKLRISQTVSVNDQVIETLVKRCKNLTELNLNKTKITGISVRHIVENLSQTLVKLDISENDVNQVSLMELQKMKKLEKLVFGYGTHADGRNIGGLDKLNDWLIEELKVLMPHLDIRLRHFEDSLRIARAFNEMGAGYGLWDVKMEVITSLPRAYIKNLGEPHEKWPFPNGQRIRPQN